VMPAPEFAGSSVCELAGEHSAAPDPKETTMMRLLFTTCLFLDLVALMPAQGIRGKVTLSGNASIVTTGHSVTLTWNSSQGATTYNVYRGAIHGGPYAKVANGLTSTTYTDVQVTHNQTLYYVTTAVSGSYESPYSNETTAVIP
jgi:hypothetical protein